MRYRVGRKLGRTLYDGELLIGIMDTPALAERACAALNVDIRWNLDVRGHIEAAIRELSDVHNDHTGARCSGVRTDCCWRCAVLEPLITAALEWNDSNPGQEAIPVPPGW